MTLALKLMFYRFFRGDELRVRLFFAVWDAEGRKCWLLGYDWLSDVRV